MGNIKRGPGGFFSKGGIIAGVFGWGISGMQKGDIKQGPGCFILLTERVFDGDYKTRSLLASFRAVVLKKRGFVPGERVQYRWVLAITTNDLYFFCKLGLSDYFHFS